MANATERSAASIIPTTDSKSGAGGHDFLYGFPQVGPTELATTGPHRPPGSWTVISPLLTSAARESVTCARSSREVDRSEAVAAPALSEATSARLHPNHGTSSPVHVTAP
jgi:hypothetical protein